jgi:acetyltransferase-like isoleucine patch superfamily enzyme
MKNMFIRWVGRKLATLVRNAELEREQLMLPGFANKPENLHVESPSRIINSSFITMGDNVSLGPGCMLNAIQRYPGRFLTKLPDGVEVQSYEPMIRIGDRVSATGYLTVSAVKSVIIEDDVIIASSVFIGDHSHGRSRTDIAYKYQPLEDISPVRIGRGCWIGEHVVIMPGVTIGNFSIIGANSVVSRDVPPKSIAVGSPSKVVKVWCENRSAWTDPEAIAAP